MKIDEEQQFEDQLKSVVRHLIRSVPKSSTHSTLLHWLMDYATYSFDDRCIVTKLLLECGAKPNAQNDDGNTPLHLLAEAFKSGSYRLKLFDFSEEMKQDMEDIKACAMLLLKNGAHPDAKNKIGVIASHAFVKSPELFSFDTFTHVTLQCLAASTMRSSGYPTDMIPKHLRAFVMLH